MNILTAIFSVMFLCHLQVLLITLVLSHSLIPSVLLMSLIVNVHLCLHLVIYADTINVEFGMLVWYI